MTLQVSTSTIHLNLGVTLVNLNGDTELMREIAIIFVEDMPSMVIALKEAFAKGDRGVVVHLAHKTRGMASNFQAEPLTDLSRKLELDQTHLSIVERERLVMQIAEVCELTIVKLKSEIGL